MASELFSAVQWHDQTTLGQILCNKTKPVNQDWLDQSGDSILTVAIKIRNNAAVDQLLAHGYSPNHAPRGQQTLPLTYAVGYTRVDVVKKLLAKGANPNQDVSSVMLDAILSTSAEVVSLLLAHGLQTARYLLPTVEANKLETVKLLLKNGPLNQNTANSALLVAASKGYLEIAQELLNSGASAQFGDADGNTALHHAAGFKIEIIAHSPYSMFTMYSAPKSVLLCESDYVVILQALVAAGADVNALNKDGCSALHVAAMCGRSELVQTLVAAGANVHALDKNQRTPLMHTLGNYPARMHECFRMLKHSTSHKQLIVATSDDYCKVIDALCGAGINVNAKDHLGRTALMSAACFWPITPDYLRKLLAAGADLSLVDKEGKSALALAIDDGFTEAAKVLQQAAADAETHVKTESAASVQPPRKANSRKKADVVAAEKKLSVLDSGNLDPVFKSTQSAGSSKGVVKAEPVPAPLPLPQPAAATFVSTTAGPSGLATRAARAAAKETAKKAARAAAVTAASKPPPVPIHAAPASAAEPSPRWLAAKLCAYGVSPAHIQLCEEKLVAQEGFISAELFAAADPSTELTPAYFTSLGITALGLQKALLRLHVSLQPNAAPLAVARVAATAVSSSVGAEIIDLTYTTDTDDVSAPKASRGRKRSNNEVA